MTKLAYIHVGLHKTATSSLQSTCATNKRQLREQGFHYPIFRLKTNQITRKISNHSAPFVNIFHPSPEKYAINHIWGIQDLANAKKQYFKTLREAVECHSKILISGEGISTIPETGILDMIRFFENYEFSIKAIACVRSPLSFHTSRTQHAIRHAVKFKQKAPSMARFISQIPRIQILKNIFGNRISFLPFKVACLDNQGPAAAVLRLCDIDPDLFVIETSNQGGDNLAVRNALEAVINGTSLQWTMRERNDILKSMRSNSKKNEKFQLTKEETNAINDHLFKENSGFLSLLGSSYCDSNYLQSTSTRLERQ